MVPYPSVESYRPCVSFVTVSRNDNHGGDLNARSQAFIGALLTQAGRHRVAIELVLVEWNPPIDRKSLADEFDWSAINEFCTVRIITVPPALHARYLHSSQLPLYQMIGKNVGIRRARGQFIAATNIDIIFDNDFFNKLARRKLIEETCYVANRSDVDQPFPFNASLEEMLEYCRSHVIRENTRWGTKHLATGDYSEIYSRLPFFIELGKAYIFSVYKLTGLAARLALSLAILLTRGVALQARSLVRMFLSFIDIISKVVRVALIAACRRSDKSVVAGNSDEDRKQMMLNIFRNSYRGYLSDVSQLLATSVSQSVATSVSQSVATSRHFGVILMEQARQTAENLRNEATHHAGHFARIRKNRNIVRLHTNACGDLTIMDRTSWSRIHGYAEYDMYSMHIDGLACWAAHVAGIPQVVLDDIHIYHIEHAAGSGFAPEHQQLLWQRLNDRGIPYIDWRLLDDLIGHLLDRTIDYRLSNVHWGLDGISLPEVTISRKEGKLVFAPDDLLAR